MEKCSCLWPVGCARGMALSIYGTDCSCPKLFLCGRDSGLPYPGVG
jgi:hypothetical protein